MFLTQLLVQNSVIIVASLISLFVTIYFLLCFIENRGNLDSPESNWTPYVSILVPAYNEEGIIGKTIEGLMEMNYPNKEIIVVDDGSTDDTVEVAREASGGDDNIRILTKENGGKPNALNYGLDYCEGELIFSLDADSVPREGAIRNMISHFEKDERVMAVVPTLKVMEPSNLWEKAQAVEYGITSFLRKMLSFINSLNVTPGAPMYRKEFFEEHGGFDETTVTEDQEMGLRIHEKGYKVDHAIDSVVYTKAPDDMKGLKTQRVRWNYGKLENLAKYKHMLSRNYGNLGTFYLPTTLASVVVPIALLLYIGANSLDRLYSLLRHQYLIEFDLEYQMASFLEFGFSPNIAHVILGFLILFSVVTYILARRRVKEIGFKLPYIFYLFIYIWILAAFQFIALVRFIFGRKPKW
ncbi:MAG: glycosyltransferase [Candidatus Aenigmatarchaeota archaeon]